MSFIASATDPFPALTALRAGEGVLALLALLAVVRFVLRHLHKGFLLGWMAGGTAFFLARMMQHMAEQGAQPEYWLAAGDGGILLAAGMVTAAILVLTGTEWLGWPLTAALPAGILCALSRQLLWPQSLTMLLGVCVAAAVMMAAALLAVVQYGRGRRELSPWLMLATLFLMLVSGCGELPAMHHFTDAPAGLFYGAVSCLIVSEEAWQRTRRLESIRSLALAIAEARDAGTLITRTLRILKDETGAGAVWFRRQEGETLRLQQSVGLPESYADLHADTSSAMRHGHENSYRQLRPEAAAAASEAQTLYALGFRGVLQLSVRGHGNASGVLYLALRRHRRFSNLEMKAVASMSSQLGAALENLQMVRRVVESQRQWASTFDSIDEMILVHDAEQRVLRINRALVEHLGGGKKWPAGRLLSEVLPGQPQQCPYCQRAKTGVTEAPDPCFGGITSVATSSYSEEGRSFGGTVHVITDVTSQREAERRYALLFEEMQEGVFIATPEGCLIDCNQAYAAIFGYENKQEIAPVGLASLYQNPSARASYLHRMRRHGYVRDFEFLARKKNGETAILTENSFAIRNAKGEIERVQGLLIDITERKRAEEELSRRNRELQAVNQIVSSLATSLDLDEILSPVLREILDLFEAESGSIYLVDAESHALSLRMSTRKDRAHGHGQSLPPLDEPLWQQLQETRPELLPQELLTALPLPANGEGGDFAALLWSQSEPLGLIRIHRATEQEFTPEDRAIFVSTARQIAGTIEKVRLYEQTARAYQDLRQTQEQLLQSEKMSALGQMISGVAHELNNPLTAIMGYTQLIGDEPLSDQGRDFSAKLLRQVQRTQRIVQNLLSFARQSKPFRQPLEIARVVDETLALRDYDLARHNLQVVRDYAAGLPAVMGDANQLEQVFLNIINNAADSMLEGGGSGTLTIRILRQGSQIWVEFHDTGQGIKDPARIFDPFYTTKPVGRGTGLGLSICYGIVKQHEGDIVAFNHATGGAVFQVRLPASVPAQEAESGLQPPPPQLLHGRVLLQSAESETVEYLRQLLTGAGATVMTVTSLEQSIACIQRQSYDAMLLSTDLRGAYTLEELHRLIARCRPEQEKRLLLLHRGLPDAATESFAREHGLAILRLPAETAELFAALSAVLDQSEACAEH
jgi:two-component system NtrC family sensor kinase